MRTLYLFFLVIFATATFSSLASDPDKDPVLLSIDDYQVKKSEFIEIYRKNNLEMEVADKKSVEEYLELFINFKLKVLEAQSLGMDTNTTFVKELEGYRQQLARPYFFDQEVNEKLVEEAYQRMLFDIRASHILIAVDEHADPADTLKAYNRIMDIYSRVKEGESFSEIARKESDDPSARDRSGGPNRPPMRGNAGDLGYFTVLNMVYPFEDAAYNTQVGDVSLPVRSPFGYHIIQVTDKLPALGKAKVAHIMVASPEGINQEEGSKHKQKIDELYEKLLQGEDFGALAAEFSDDKASGSRQGELPEFTCNRMVPEFIKAISELENPGDFSKPVKTNFGWHLVKLIDKKGPGSFEDEYYALKERIARDSRSKLSREVVLDRLKEEYNFEEHSENLEDFFEVVDSSVFEAKWDLSKAEGLDGVLFSLAGVSYNQKNFAEYIAETQAVRTPEGIVSYVKSMYNNWKENAIISYEDSQLERKYPEFKSIMQEYHDGILLFELTDEMVWNRAVQDTTGLESFYLDKQDDYMWQDRLHATIYVCKDRKTARQTYKKARKILVNPEDYEQVLGSVNGDSQTDVSARQGKFEAGEEPVFDHVKWEKGINKPFKLNDRFVVVYVHDVIPAQPKKMDEIRGVLVSDYQNHLEKEWVKQLRDKYNIEINKQVLDEISF